MISLLAALALSGCTDTDDTQPLTWHRDAAPLIDAYCGDCHVDGGVAPFALTTYDEVYTWRAAIQSSITARTMPPWSAAGDCADYDYDTSLTDEQIGTLSDWIDEGAPEGDAADAGQSITLDRQTLSRVDSAITLEAPYTPDFSAGADEYRCFVLDWPEAEATNITGFTVDPGETDAIHHVIAFMAPPESAALYEALEEEDGTPGYACYGGPGGDNTASWVGGWVPGGVGGDFPEGTGLPVEPGSRVVLQLHMNAAASDTSAVNPSLQLQLAESVDMTAKVLPFTNPAWLDSDVMNLPAGEVTTHSFSYPVPGEAQVYSGSIHMHQLGVAARLWIEHTDGTESCLYETDRYDFNWQRAYWLAEPAQLEAGDELHVSCTWDNTTDTDITWGEGTADEMCLGISYLVY